MSLGAVRFASPICVHGIALSHSLLSNRAYDWGYTFVHGAHKDLGGMEFMKLDKLRGSKIGVSNIAALLAI